MRVPAGYVERVARAQIGQSPFDQDVGAAVEAEILKVDTRAQR
jgi:hypothetical protein